MDKFFKRYFGHISVLRLLTGAFGLLLLLSLTSAAYLLISNGNRLVHKVVADGANATSQQATVEISRFLQSPAIIGRSVKNAVAAGYIDINDRQATTRFFYELPQRDAEYGVSGIYIADPQGNFIGVDSDLVDGKTRWFQMHASASTNGLLLRQTIQTLHPQPPSHAGGKPFDPRLRPWYKKAVASDGPVWTDIYSDASSGAPVLTWASAIRDENSKLIAIVGVDLLISRISQFLEQLSLSENSAVILTDPGGSLISDSVSSASQPSAASASALTSTEFLRYLDASYAGINTFKASFETQARINEQTGLLKIMPLSEDIEMAWYIGTFIPFSDYVDSLKSYLIRIIPAALLTLFITWLALQLFLRLTVKPLYQLRSSANKIANGKFSVFIDTGCSNEVGELAASIDSMRRRLQQTFAQLTEQKIRAETTLGSIADGVVTFDTAGNIDYINPAARKQSGLSADAVPCGKFEQLFKARDHSTGRPLVSETFMASIAGRQHYNCELTIADHKGAHRQLECSVAPIIKNSGCPPSGAVMVLSDITDQAQLKSELLRQASIDNLTGLMNRREFDIRLQNAVKQAAAKHNHYCLCYMDLDQFKVVNDTCGHIAGDELLKQIARLLRQRIRAGDTIARLGGDEFALLLDSCTVEQAARVTDSVLRSIGDYRFVWHDQVFSIGISIGIVAIDTHTTSHTDALADADTACYAAKDAGRNRAHVYNADSAELSDRREQLLLVNKLDQALQDNRFTLLVQQIEPVAKNAPDALHFEVLLRMPDDDGVPVSPASFLPVAERFNLASRIDRWVVASTLRHLEQYPQTLPRIHTCAINLSGQSLGDDSFLPDLLELLAHSSVANTKICFEVTETAAIANLNNALDMMNALKESGCRFALDDFGRGFSSLAYLKTLPFDFLKIDGLFVRDILIDQQDLAMVRLINEIGQTMGMKTIAEYVESDDIRHELAALGVDYVQGYAINKPQPIDVLQHRQPTVLQPAD